MKKLICALTMALVVPALSLAAEQVSDSDQIIVKTEQKSVFKGLLYKVWGRLRALNPQANNRNRNRTAVTAGIRGAETTDSLISPYWMDDRTDDPDYIKELTEYTKAQQLAEDGNLPAAVKALSAFIENHGDSDLKPNAQFALGISYAGLGQNKAGVDELQLFVSDNPEHPLVADAKQVIAELK
jgi:TolA-binding protein